MSTENRLLFIIYLVAFVCIIGILATGIFFSFFI